jgi:hypothetical protein
MYIDPYMWFNLLINIIISCIIILVGHHLWIYFKEKYSVKKTKDMVGSQIQKYKNLLETIQQENHIKQSESSCNITILDNPTTLNVSADPLLEFDDIKQDLELFLQEIPV